MRKDFFIECLYKRVRILDNSRQQSLTTASDISQQSSKAAQTIHSGFNADQVTSLK